MTQTSIVHQIFNSFGKQWSAAYDFNFTIVKLIADRIGYADVLQF